MSNGRTCAVLSAAAVGIVGLSSQGVWGQTFAPGTRIRTDIRSIVTQQYSGGAGVGVGILDTGDNTDTLSRETARRLGINVTTPLDTNAAGAQLVYNYGTTTAQNITGGGWFGAVLNGPELNSTAAPPPVAAAYVDPQVRLNDPAHLFTTANVGNTGAVVSNGLLPSYSDYNGRNSENHQGSTFLAQSNVANNLVAMIDPINGTPLPFSYDNVNGGNGRNLGGAAGLDRLASSVSYFANNNSQVPIQGRNDDPGFVTFVPLTPMMFGASTPLTAQPGAATVNAALPVGVDRRLTLTVAAADAANATVLIPANLANNPPQNPNAFLPTYRPGDASAVNTAPAFTSAEEVRNNTINIAGQENPNGFQRRDGSVQVVVKSSAAGNPTLFTQTVALPSEAPRPYGSIVIPSLGINTGAAALIDTGAPNTTPGTIVGTDVLNRFGQYFDFSARGNGATPNRGMLTLIGPTQQNVINAVGNGMVFTVDQGTTGLQRTAVNFTSGVGSVPQLVAGAGGSTLVSDGVASQAAQTVFRGNMTGSNAAYITPAAQGLTAGAAGQVITGMSMGGDAFGPDSDIYFGIAPGSVGSPGTAVEQQGQRNQNASDIYYSGPRGPFAVTSTDPLVARRQAPKGNSLFANQEVLGIGQNVGPGANAGATSDNMLDFKLFTGRALPGNSLSNMDSPIRQANEVAPASRPRVGADVLANNFDTYFALRGTDGIFKDNVANQFATDAEMGLLPGDHINSMALYRPSVSPGVAGAANVAPGTADAPSSPFFTGLGLGRFDPNLDGSFAGIDDFHGSSADLVMFTLAPDSPSLTAFGPTDLLSSADVFVSDFDDTFTMYASAEQMGLNFGDVIDGLSPIPEPGSLGILGLVGLMTLRGRKSRQRLRA